MRTVDASTHRAEVEAWRRQRYERLRAEVGWLTLTGLAWLRPGPNTVGTDPGSDAVLPAGPRTAGTITVGPDGARASGTFRHDGRAVDDLPLRTDRDGEATLLELDHLRLCVIDRGGHLALRTWDTQAAQRGTFSGIDHWPVDPRWRLQARFEPTPGHSLVVPNVLDLPETEISESPGEVVFEEDGAEHRLQALSGGAAGELWLVFGDATNGVETYAGGRYLYTEPPATDATVVVDFNRAYNPPCVFSPHATCPLPWPANQLPLRVTAGERAWQGRSPKAT